MDKYKHFELKQIPYLLLLIALSGYLFYIKNIYLSLLVIVLTLATFLYFNTFHIFKRKEWDKFVDDSIEKLSPSWVNMIDNMPYPVVGFTRDGNIIWYNLAFKGLFNEDKKLIELDEVLMVDVEKIWKDEGPDSIDINKRTYSVTPIKYKASNDEFQEDLIFFHLIDITSLREVENKKVVTLLVEVDNMTEVLNSVPEDRRPLVVAEIEREMLNYASHLKGFMKKYGPSKAVIIAPFEVIREEIKNKFPILDSIKRIAEENSMEPTISIGIGYDNGGAFEDGEAATKAKELALGRGGDQAVIKVGEKLSFYGGNSREMEKKSKVRSRVISHALRDLILDSPHVFIMGHTNPDMDCLGAAVGVHAIVKSLDKESFILMDEPHRNVNDLLDRLKEDEDYNNIFISSEEALNAIKPNDLLIIVDVHSLGYVLSKEMAQKNVKKVVIDHHRRAQDAIQASIISYIETYASSTSELVTELIQYVIEKPRLTKIEADALLAGIWVDTKNFYFKTGVRTFEAASFLRKAGANTIDIRSMFSYDKDLYLLKASIVESADILDGIAIAVCPEDLKDPVIIAQAADEFLNIKGIHTSFVLAQLGNDVSLSARSLGDVNVQVITEEFGGGGHSTMSGAKVLNSTVEVVKERLVKLLDDIKDKED